jgi:hypothetical protein
MLVVCFNVIFTLKFKRTVSVNLLIVYLNWNESIDKNISFFYFTVNESHFKRSLTQTLEYGKIESVF